MPESSITPDRELLCDSDKRHGKVTAMLTVSVRRFEDGCSHAHVSHLDNGNRQMIPGPHWCLVDVPGTRDELLRWCARVADATREDERVDPPLPW